MLLVFPSEINTFADHIHLLLPIKFTLLQIKFTLLLLLLKIEFRAKDIFTDPLNYERLVDVVETIAPRLLITI